MDVAGTIQMVSPRDAKPDAAYDQTLTFAKRDRFLDKAQRTFWRLQHV
jgi:hypothetical protein